jgi:hypothetical protein
MGLYHTGLVKGSTCRPLPKYSHETIWPSLDSIRYSTYSWSSSACALSRITRPIGQQEWPLRIIYLTQRNKALLFDVVDQ